MNISEENQTESTLKSSSKKIHFTADRSCIPTLPQNEQESELSGLDIEIYRQDVLEKEILDQVDRAFSSHAPDNKEKIVHFQNKQTNKDFKNEKECLNIIDEQEIKNEKEEYDKYQFSIQPVETEKEKKIRMGEMTPFGTVIPQKIIESNHLENIEEYLRNQIKISNNRKGSKRKISATKNKIDENVLPCNIKKKKAKTESNSEKIALSSKSDLSKKIDAKRLEDKPKNVNQKIEYENSSGSEYVPSESDQDLDDYDPDFELKLNSKKNFKGRKNAKESYEKDFDSDNDRFRSQKAKEVDDGNENNYFDRMEIWEKKYNRLDIETSVKDLGDGFKVPQSIWSKLYKYQKVGVQWLWELHLQHCGGIIGDEMGLGKTIQIIAFLAGLSVSQLLSRHGSFRGLGPVLIVCPTTVMHQWVREFHTWWPPFRVALLHESGSFNGKKSDLIKNTIKNEGILITSYVTCIQQSSVLLRHIWHYIVLDEGHKIRNPESQITHIVKLFKTPHRLILSGSPIQNNLKELWSLFDFIFPGKLGTLPVFLAELGVPITQGGFANASKVQVATAFKCATVLRDTISPYLLRRAKEDVKSHINLPPKNEQVLFCKLTEEQERLYMDYLNSGKVSEILNGRLRVFIGLIDLRKICNHPHLYTGRPKNISKWDCENSLLEEEQYGHWKKAGKMIVLETVLRIWKKQGHRVLIFTQSRKMLSILENFILEQNYEYLKMDGSTTIGSRQPLINKFNEDKKYYVFLSTTHVGGLGVNLTGANRVVIYDPDWNPATDMQARERAWRLGQENQVTIYRFVTSGTIEEKIYHRQIYKQFLTNKVLKDPSQRRFFKSNDLYELFTYKGGDQGNETSAIFAGTDVEVNLNNLSKKSKKRKFRNVNVIEPKSIKKDIETQNILSQEKIKKMKEMAQALSRKIALEALDAGGNLRSDVSGSVPISLSQNDKTCGEKNKDVASEKVTSKKSKKKKSRDKFLEGELIPHLQKTRRYREIIQDKTSYEKDDDYILKKLFSKSGVQSALKHDQLVETGSADYALIEGEAEKIAKEAVKALKESRKEYLRNHGEMQQTPISVTKPRFGRKTFGRQQSSSEMEKDKFMSSQELLQRIRERNGLCLMKPKEPEDAVSENSELLADIRNFISFGAEEDNKATTQEIINKLPTGQTPLFKALLNEICEFRRTASGEGVWELRSDFRW